MPYQRHISRNSRISISWSLGRPINCYYNPWFHGSIRFISGLCQFSGSEPHPKKAYHSVANGLVERFHRRLKRSLISQADTSKCSDALPLVPHGIRSTIKEDIGCTSAELIYGTTPTLPGQLVNQDTNDPTRFASRLLQTMQNVEAIPPP